MEALTITLEMIKMDGLKVGHTTNTVNGTGVTVFLFEQPAVGAYFLAGSGPASHELAPLDPETSVQNLHGLVLSGGSAFGLNTASGAMRFLAEQGIGLRLPHGVVPIVPAVAIYDLAYKNALPPTAEDAYQACLSAKKNNTESGRIGAGTGATVGKIVPNAKHMTSGLGYASLSLANGLTVSAYAVVNAVGDVRNAEGKIIAGARWPNGEFADCQQFLIDGHGETILIPQTNTTLVAVFTNAKFSKSELKRLAKMAVAGMARAITPVFTCYDGDILFAISIGTVAASILTTGTLAAEVVRQAIVHAVNATEVIP